jgi:adenosylhomocysteine nucleosidase
MTSPLLAVTGLKREAALLAGPGVVMIPGGGDSPALLAKLEAAFQQHPPRGVISIGLGGALSPVLAVGDWVVADSIVSGNDVWPAQPTWAAELYALLRASMGVETHLGPIAASETMVVDGASKAALHAKTSALAVDMESHVAARFASTHGLPFAALRVISDGADRALPRAAQAGMKKDGGMDILAVLKSLAMDPAQLPALIRTGKEAEVAFKALGRVRPLLAEIGA